MIFCKIYEPVPANTGRVFTFPEYSEHPPKFGEYIDKYVKGVIVTVALFAFKKPQQFQTQTTKIMIEAKTPVKHSDIYDFWMLAFENVRKHSEHSAKFTLDDDTVMYNERVEDTHSPHLFISGDFETSEGKLLHIDFSMETDSGYAHSVECIVSNP